MASSSGRKHSRPQTGQSSEAAPSQLVVRPILVEREIILDDFRDLTWEGRSIHDIIIDRGWTPICRQRGATYLEMVGEFYHAMEEQSGDALCYNLVVREVSIIFSPRVIAEFLDLWREPGTYPAAPTPERAATAPSAGRSMREKPPGRCAACPGRNGRAAAGRRRRPGACRAAHQGTVGRRPSGAGTTSRT